MGDSLPRALGQTIGIGHVPAGPGALARAVATSVAAASVLAGKALIGLGLRRAPEGWRRTVGVLLRGESTRFALSGFGLRVPPAGTLRGDAAPDLEHGVATALHAFLNGEPDAHFALEWRKAVTLRRRTDVVDLAVLGFGSDGTLQAIDPHFGSRGPSTPPAAVRARVHDLVIQAYNRTARLPEVERTVRLLEAVGQGIGSAPMAYAQRLLSACCLSFESGDPADPAWRFVPPAFHARRPLGFGYLSWVGRTNDAAQSVDLWASAHHVGLDGVPLQDLLERLERAWGRAEAVRFPAPAPGTAFAGPHACHVPGERAVDQLVTFVDLAPVFSLRRQLSARLAGAIGGEVTFGTLIAWLLAQEPEFRGVRIASTVDVRASGGYERDVDVVSLRPADFAAGEGPWGGFVEYAREFNRLIAAARARTSPVRAGMQTAGLMPAWAHATMVRANPAALDDTFGTLCVTIIRDARVFVAPMTDLGLGHGFFAIGSATLPSTAGTPVTAISIKGDAGRVAHYPAILQRIVERCAGLQADGA